MDNTERPGPPEKSPPPMSRRRFVGAALTVAAGAGALVRPNRPKSLARKASAAAPPGLVPSDIEGLKYQGTQPAANVGKDILASLDEARVRHLALRGMPDVSVERLIAALEDGNLSEDGEQDVLVRMHGDLKRALEKPMNERRWAMAIDLRKCVGCSACTIACVVENKLPPGVVYRPVIEEETGTYPNVSRRFLPRPCMQCADPPCTPACPVTATWKREDGIVVMDYEACIGCRYCITACPYNARTFDFGANYTDGAAEGTAFLVGREVASGYESAPSYEYGQEWTRDDEASPVGNARKCHFCAHRLDAGMLPQCVTTCIGRATYFGDRSDPGSLISDVIGRPNVIRLKEELGTDPQVYYLL